MASSRRTYDTDSITLRTVFAKNPGNSNVPALRVLTADGAGGTYWAIPSSLGLNPSFNEIITSAATYTADLSYNKFRLLAGENIGMVNGPAGSNQTTLYAKAFSQFDLSGGNTIQAFTNNQLDSSVLLAGENGIALRSDPGTNTLFISGTFASNTTISTGIYGFSQIKVTPAASTITSSVTSWDGSFLTATSPSTVLRLIGYNDIQLSTNVTTNSVFFTISTFTSQGYINISNAAVGAYPSTLSTVNNLFVGSTLFASTVNSLSSMSGVDYSTIQSSIKGLSISTGFEILTLQGLVNARATIVQLNSEIANVNSNLISTVGGLGSAGYISTAGGGSGDVTKENLFSTVGGLGTANYVSTLSLYSTLSTFSTALGSVGSGDVSRQNLVSTTFGLQTSGFLSTTVILSTVAGLGSIGYLSSLSSLYLSTGNIKTGSIETSTVNLQDTLNGEIRTLNSSNNALYFNGTLVGSGSVINNYNTSSYIYQVSSVSSIFAYDSVVISSATNVFLSPQYFSSIFFSTGALQTSSINFVDTQTGAKQVLAVNNSVLQLNGSPIQGDVTVGNLRSTIANLGTSGYISTASLVSTTFGLQTSGFLSSMNLTSTVTGLSNIVVTKLIAGTNITLTPSGGQGEVTIDAAGGGGGGITTANLTSTVTGLGSSQYISSLSFQSTSSDYFQCFSTSAIVLSSASMNYKLTASTNTLTQQPYLWMNNRIYGTYNPITVVVSTLTTTTDPIILANDVGKYFLYTNSCNVTIQLPSADASLNGWNIVIKNMPASGTYFTVNTTTAAVLAPGVATTVVCDGTTFYSI